MEQALGIASIIGSLILIGITTWYAWQTQQMVREMRQARIETLRPSVILDLGVVGGTAYLSTENVGVGPAKDISVTITVYTDDEELESHTWTRALFRSGESQTLLVPAGPTKSLMGLSELKEMGAQATMKGTCLDLDGRTHNINDTLSFAELGDRSPEGEWESVDSRWPKNVEKMAKELEGIHSFLKNSQNPWRGV